MKRAQFKKTMVATIVLLVLTLSILSGNVFLANADAGGTGKFLTVKFAGTPSDATGFNVTATKIFSGQVWTYSTSGDSWKLGAGDVSLQAFCPPDYHFVSWTLEGDETTTDYINPTIFKTEKYAVVTATFASNGYRLYLNVVGHGSVTVSDEQDYYVAGESVTLTFTPDNYELYHLSSVIDNGAYADLVQTDFTYSYDITFYEDHYVTVRFDETGTATVPAGNGVTVFLSYNGSLTFTNSGTGGFASGGSIPSPNGTSVFLWEIDTTVEFGSDYVLITLKNEGDPPSLVYTADSADQLYSDVNGDGVVSQDDMVEVAVAISTNGRNYIAEYDVNRDGKLSQQDIATVKKYLGTSLTLIPYVAYSEFPSSNYAAQWTYFDNLIFIQTDHFSIFRGR